MASDTASEIALHHLSRTEAYNDSSIEGQGQWTHEQSYTVSLPAVDGGGDAWVGSTLACPCTVVEHVSDRVILTPERAALSGGQFLH